MKSLMLDEILREVARAGVAESDWLFLLNIYFREGKERALDEWAREHHLNWRRAEYDREPNERGQLIVFSKGVNWKPSSPIPPVA